MSKEIPKPGTYGAVLAGVMSVYFAETGALCVAVPYRLTTAEVAFTGKHTVTVCKADGSVNTTGYNTLKEVFGWDGLDTSWLMDTDLTQVAFEIVGSHDNSYIPEGKTEAVLQFKSDWLNPVGGSARIPEAADRKEVLAKFGAKFRALSGGKAATAPAAKPAAKPSDKPAAAPAPSAPPKAPAAPAARPKADPMAPTATMEEAWGMLVDKNPELDETELTVVWWKVISETCPGKEVADLGLKDWGAVKVAVESAAA